MEEKITAWVVRDENMSLYLFFVKPKKNEGYKCWDIEYDEGMWGTYSKLGKDIFPRVKWEDKEPTEVELTIKILNND